MKKEDAYYLGKIVKKYGIKGELLAKIDTDEPEQYENLESIFLESQGKLVPFFLNNASLHKATTLRLDFEDVNNIEEADALIGKSIYLPLSSLPELTGNKFYFHEVLGFEAIDEKFGKIGKIEAINDQAPQAFFIIKDDQNHEILIPVSDQFITKVDREQKQIVFNTPEGLIDLYRQS
ncbi:MAG TPA: 16S rRNA processing protein RimM [Flavobacteriales bacterium]|jgi:16S rRNA processing protein RimM|nr:16S rRNA processing protein RimM [Flavobacteriales bacterium]